MKPTMLLPAMVAAMMLFAGIACGGAAEETAPAPPTAAPAAATQAPQQQQPAAPAPATQAAQPAQPAAQPTAVIATATPRPTNTPSAAQQSEVIGGSLRIATIPPIQELIRSWLGTNTSANAQVRPFAEPLVHTDRFDGSLQPGMATEWELTKPDGTQWVVRLREGIQFHRGWGEFTAHDVPHSTAVIVRDDAIATDTGLFRGLFGETEAEVLENIRVVDDYTLEFNLLRTEATTPMGCPTATWWFNLLRTEATLDFVMSAQQGNLFIYSKAQWDADGEQSYVDQPAGNGPWQFESRQLGVGGNVLYSRVADHWRQTPFWSELEYVNTPEAATRLASLLAGQVQMAEVNRDLHAEAISGGMQINESTLPAIQVAFIMGGIYSPLSPFHDPSDPHLDVRFVRRSTGPSIATKSMSNCSTARASRTRFGDTTPACRDGIRAGRKSLTRNTASTRSAPANCSKNRDMKATPSRS